MLNISKENFVFFLNQIQKGLDRRNKFSDYMEEFCDGFYICELGNEWLNAAIKLLCAAVHDKETRHGTVIEWYLYEDVKKEIYIHTKENPDKEIVMDCSTPELLYDYFEYQDKQRSSGSEDI